MTSGDLLCWGTCGRLRWNYGSSAVGSANQFVVELFQSMAMVNSVRISDTRAGPVPMMFLGSMALAAAPQYVLVALAVTRPQATLRVPSRSGMECVEYPACCCAVTDLCLILNR